jgi:1-deoxy-D-xylulose-5-phosphate reductoisomerase
MKNICILGSTGSIGTQTLDVVRNHPEILSVKALSCDSRIDLLLKQINEFHPEAVAVMQKGKADELSQQADIPVYYGIEGFNKIACMHEADTVVNSLVGSVGLEPTIKAIKSNKNIALANKETLVIAGELVMKAVEHHNVNIIPIDSEHVAIHQCLAGGKKHEIHRIIVTASGGPFRDYTQAQLEKATVKDALNHPTWRMGSKITIDSSTLMNKGFEILEAHHLFNVPLSQIKAVIHPQSIIHSMVEFVDGNLIAQIGVTDMRIPIKYALTYPERIHTHFPKLNLVEIEKLTFHLVNKNLFPCIKYAREAGEIGGSMPVVLNAANEVAVDAFLNGQIGFLDIPKTIRKMMDSHKMVNNPDLDCIIDLDKKVKKETQAMIN